jgi:hypothetical protein
MSEIILSQLPLETLAEMVNESAELAERSIRDAVQHALRCGRALQACKSQLPHGKWLGWLRVNFDRDISTAERYMRLAENWETVPNLQQAESMRQALRLIAEDRRGPEPIEIEPEPVEMPESRQAPEPEAVEEESETDPQERPSIAVSRSETQKASEADRPKPAPVTAQPVLMWARAGVEFRPATADEVAAAALLMVGAVGLRAYIAEQEASRRA